MLLLNEASRDLACDAFKGDPVSNNQGSQPGSGEPRHTPDTVGEEASATGQRIKGATEKAAGAVSGNDRLEEKGRSENAEGEERQRNNDAV